MNDRVPPLTTQHKLLLNIFMSQHHTPGRQGHGPRRRYHKGGRPPYANDRNGYRPRHRHSAPKKLTFWQKVLKFLGLYKPATKPITKHEGPKPTKSNTRIARTKGNPRNTGPKQPVSSARLYVGNLSYEATETDLEDLFKGIGGVKSVEIIYNPRTHKSKGYAFIEMQFMDDAKRSVEILHNQPFMGRNLLVSGANERQETIKQAPASSRNEEDDIPMSKEHTTPLLAPNNQ